MSFFPSKIQKQISNENLKKKKQIEIERNEIFC